MKTAINSHRVSTPTVPVLHHAGRSDRCGTFTPAGDGPPVLIVGTLASAEKICSLARRHGFEASMLLDFARKGGPA